MSVWRTHYLRLAPPSLSFSGESCWASFRDRVQREYNYTLYTCHQRYIDGLLRGKFERCVVETEKLCVAPFCTPAVATYRYRRGTFGRPPASGRVAFATYLTPRLATRAHKHSSRGGHLGRWPSRFDE